MLVFLQGLDFFVVEMALTVCHDNDVNNVMRFKVKQHTRVGCNTEGI